MNTVAKSAIVGVGLGFLWYYLRKPKITVLSANAAAGSVTYKMSIDGESITDTVVMGDQRQLVPAGKTKYWFYANTEPNKALIELVIGYYTPEGAFQGVVGKIISF
jgi:hypothetical protein